MQAIHERAGTEQRQIDQRTAPALDRHNTANQRRASTIAHDSLAQAIRARLLRVIESSQQQWRRQQGEAQPIEAAGAVSSRDSGTVAQRQIRPTSPTGRLM